jgi:hypothetical protein
MPEITNLNHPVKLKVVLLSTTPLRHRNIGAEEIKLHLFSSLALGDE